MIMLLILAPVGGVVAAQTPEKAPGRPQTSGTRPERSIISGIRFDPGNRRDPFTNLLVLRQRASDQNQVVEAPFRPPGIGGMRIAEVFFAGTSTRQDGIIAVVRGNDKRTYFLREGDRLFDGFVKKIDSDVVRFVQESKLRSGKIITQEVSKRLREN